MNERKLQEVPKLPSRVTEKVDWLNGAIWSRETWLDDHATKWPATDVEIKRHGLEIMREIRDDYERSVAAAKARKEAADEQG